MRVKNASMENQAQQLRLRREAQSKPNNGAFMKSLIKINNPDWTTEQVEAEFQARMARIEQEEGNGECEACSG